VGVAAVPAGEDQADQRVQDVLGDRADDLAYRRADDDADRESQGILLQQESLEILQHGDSPLFSLHREVPNLHRFYPGLVCSSLQASTARSIWPACFSRCSA